MKISAQSAPNQGLTTIVIEHAGQTQRWDVTSTYGRSNTRGKGSSTDEEIDPDKLFDEINGFFATLNPEIQQYIFDTYNEIQEIFKRDSELEVVTDKLKQRVRKLYSMISMAALRHYLHYYGNVNYPSTVKESLAPEDVTDRTLSRTYLRSDYFGLVVFTVMLRPMIPVWGEYIAASRRDSGNNYKENRAWGLLYHTEIPHSAEYERLLEFITHSSQSFLKDDVTFTAVLEGLSTAEMPSWMLALTAVRRLAVSEIHPDPDKKNKNLIAMVHFFIDSKILSMPRDFGRKFGGRISDKKPPSGTSEENNSSVVEMYKIKPDLPDGHIVTLNVYAEDAQRMRAARDISIPPEMLERCLQHIAPMGPTDLSDNQRWITSWVMHSVIPCRTVPQLLIGPLKNTMAVAQAALWHWGFYDLAVLVTATPQLSNEEIIVGAAGDRGRLNKDTLQELKPLFNFHPPVKRNLSARQQRIEVRAIDMLGELINRNDWYLNAPPELIKLSSTVEDSRMMIVPPTVKTQLANLILHPKFES